MQLQAAREPLARFERLPYISMHFWHPSSHGINGSRALLKTFAVKMGIDCPVEYQPVRSHEVDMSLVA